MPEIQQVFISYKSEYRPFARKLRDQLNTWGYRTWFDQDDIPTGQYFRHAIQHGLESSDVVVGVMTPEAFASREVMWEWDYALYHSRLIPVRYRDCELPYHLVSTQYIDFTTDENQAFQHLRLAIENPDGIPHPSRPAQQAETSLSRPVPIVVKPDDTNRAVMLQKVREFWVTGVLENALHETEAFDLGLETAAGAVLRHVDYGDYSLPGSAGSASVFEDMNRELLILGAPGSGKTIMLLQLARDRINHALNDPKQPIPVVFNLSSWAAARAPLERWLVDELRTKYQVPQKIAAEWIGQERLLLLLDGLDEVIPDYRDACVDAINAFRQDYRSVDMVVCSRIADYDALTRRLDLQGAVVLQPLTRQQIDRYITRDDLAGLREVMQTDLTLQSLAQVPFLLNTMAFAYRDTAAAALRLAGDQPGETGRRDDLFARYVDRRLHDSPGTVGIPLKQARRYLSWLAARMHTNGQTVFYIEALQPGWLPSVGRRRWYALIVNTVIGLIFGAVLGMAAGLAASLAVSSDLPIDPVRKTLFWVTAGLLMGTLAGGLSGFASGWVSFWLGKAQENIRVVEALSWSWPRALLGLVFGVPVGWVGLLNSGPMVGVTVGLSFGLTAASFTGLAGVQVDVHTSPNQGIWRSAQNALRVTLAIVLSISLSFLLASLIAGGNGSDLFRLVLKSLAIGTATGLTAGLALALFFGGLACLQHGVLRLLLWRDGQVPLNYARFLDQAVRLVFMRKVGGGYIFVHRLLLDYLAAQENAAGAESA